MRTFRNHQVRSTAFAVGLLAFVLPGVTLRAAPTNTVAAAKSEGFAVQSLYQAPVVPMSEFVMPKNRAEGRDPFFPNSTRPYGVDATVKSVVPVTPVADLTLKGISGTDEQPLAIINNTTFTNGEENDVTTKAGKMRIRCIEIHKDAGTVLIQVGGERRELRLAPRK